MATVNPIAPSGEGPSVQIQKPHGRTGQSVLDLIGNTPLLRLSRIGSEFLEVEFCAKAEWFNPGGSVKDRPALSMIHAGLASGALRPGKTIIDATSGNTGIAYATVAAALGYPVKLCLPDSASHERKRILGALGAELVITSGDEGTDGAIRKVHEIVATDPEKYFYPDQYSNPANWRAHYRTTANEIWEQTSGRITHFVAALGTSGTFVGTSRRLKELKPSIRCISLQPDAAFHGLEGWKHMPTALRPAIYDDTLADENLEVSTEAAYRMVKRIARMEGLLVSPSAAAALIGCFEVAKRVVPEQRTVIVTIFADSASKYLTERFWDEE
jgi:cysteine synthase B